MIAAAVLLLAQAVQPAPAIIRVEQVKGRCRITVGDRTYDPQREGKTLSEALASIPADQPVRLEGQTAVPFRCIGGAIYTMQINGVRKIGFIAEPNAPSPKK